MKGEENEEAAEEKDMVEVSERWRRKKGRRLRKRNGVREGDENEEEDEEKKTEIKEDEVDGYDKAEVGNEEEKEKEREE